MKYVNLTLIVFLLRINMVSSLKRVKLDLLTDIDMLLPVQKDIRGRMCYAFHRYAKVSNNYMKDYDKNKGSSYTNYWNANLKSYL